MSRLLEVLHHAIPYAVIAAGGAVLYSRIMAVEDQQMAILDELERTRKRGYAIDNSERDPNVRCVGVPVYNAKGKLVAGISTSGPAVTMTDEKLLECAGILQNASLKMRDRIYG